MNKQMVGMPDPGRRAISLMLILLAPVLLLYLAVSLSSGGSVEATTAKQEPQASLRNLFADGQGVTFTLETPVISPLPDGDFRLDGLDGRSNEPGSPALPYFTTYVALPPEANARLTLDRVSTLVQMNVDLPTVSEQVPDAMPLLGDQERMLSNTQQEPARQVTTSLRPTAAGEGGLFPAALFDISEPMIFRDVRLVRITLFPYRYDKQRQLLAISPEISVSIDFQQDGAAQPRRPAASHNEQHIAALSQLVINPEQISAFRSLPADMPQSESALPLGIDLFKIAASGDGIHQVTYEELAAAGMDVNSVDPATFEMLYRGLPVAFDFIGDLDATFEPGESIRFFGFDFHGSRMERQFIIDNIFWLWAGGESRPISTRPSVPGEKVYTVQASLTHEPELVYHQGYTADWPENEPDAWYWDRFSTSRTPITVAYTVTLPYPALSGPSAQFTAEFSAHDSHIDDQAHQLSVAMNGHPNTAGRSWYGEKNFNVSATVPQSNVLGGDNRFDVTAWTDGGARVAINRITVDYERRLITENDQLIFSDQDGGQHEFALQGFSQPDLGKALIWDISDPYSPTAILSSTIAVAGTGPYTYTFGSDNESGAAFIATISDALLSATDISRYVAPEIDPPGGAEWVAIAYGGFLTETNRLAAHRSLPSFGGLTSHVVNIDDVVNQYGYGLPVPVAVQEYLSHALATWPVKPSYVTLVGDTTLDPRGIKADWTDPQLMLTDLVFVDRYQGHIPSDLTFALVSGQDILPDLAVGRIAASSEEELRSAIDKIIRYDENQLLSFGWMENMLFVADRTDPDAGDFCHENQRLGGDHLPMSLNPIFLCVDNYPAGGPELRNDMLPYLNNDGVTMLLYRGHGGVGYWDTIFSTDHMSLLTNEKPFVTVSGECLDGHFAYPPLESLGEAMVSSALPAGDMSGAAAHWGSSGLGVASDHTAILDGFYDGLFLAGQTALGDAATYAKIAYASSPWTDPALMYSFNLQGDPAMHLMRPNLKLSGAWQQAHARLAGQASVALEVQNIGVYPAPVTVSAGIPPGFSISSISSTLTHTVSITGNSAEIVLQFGQDANDAGLPRHAQASIVVNYDLAPEAQLGQASAHFVAEGGSLEAWPGDESVHDDIYVVGPSAWLPTIRR